MTTRVNLQLLVVFCAVAERESFSKAATKLGVAKGTVSRSIAQLESLLEVELIHRTTHHVSLSTAGVELYERTRGHLKALQAALVELPELDEEPSGMLRMTVPHDFGTVVLPPLLGAYARRYPSVRFDIRLTGEVVDLNRDGYDLAIRAVVGSPKDSTLTMRRLAKSTSGFYAAPSYIARRGRARTMGDKQHTWIAHPSVIPLLNLSVDQVQFVVDDFQMARDLARDGVGIVMLPSFIAREYVRDGLLEEVPLSDAAVLRGDLVMLYPSSGQLPRKVSSFRDFLVEALRAGIV